MPAWLSTLFFSFHCRNFGVEPSAFTLNAGLQSLAAALNIESLCIHPYQLANCIGNYFFQLFRHDNRPCQSAPIALHFFWYLWRKAVSGSETICASIWLPWRFKTPSSGTGQTSSFIGQPLFFNLILASPVLSFFAVDSRALIAVESRPICPMSCLPKVFLVVRACAGSVHWSQTL